MRLDPAESRRRFAASRVARLAMAGADGRPFVVVVTFAMVGDVVVTAVDRKPKSTTRLRRLEIISANPLVSLLVDHYDDADWTALWWVRADGAGRVLERPEDRAEPVAWLSEKYPQYAEEPPDGPVVRVEITGWRGWAASAR
jgi:PPOX class probable F420-dependent enzyme